MSQTSIPPSPTFTADSKPHRGGIHEPSPMLESYLSEEPTVTARLLIAEKRDVDKERLEAAKNQISAFQKQMSEQS
ncbi:hypothetical protein FHL15_003429 [Xylaria flabelliformis]|uniref:Uncharacterized protein n=1 Tax=Xylaria flabelliformis TaxID=2512241 RepID=A0A553I6P1_9PEZI|nr:hypothetical protein FHL15_003429 [Xylaria flabelliformis]